MFKYILCKYTVLSKFFFSKQSDGCYEKKIKNSYIIINSVINCSTTMQPIYSDNIYTKNYFFINIIGTLNA